MKKNQKIEMMLIEKRKRKIMIEMNGRRIKPM
jgi:hypothetical protein